MKIRIELESILEQRKKLLERKLKSKREPHFYGVNPNVLIETEAKIEEIEWILKLLKEVTT